jgi:hypothetical protein
MDRRPTLKAGSRKKTPDPFFLSLRRPPSNHPELNQGIVALIQLGAKETAPPAPLRVPMRPSP